MDNSEYFLDQGLDFWRLAESILRNKRDQGALGPKPEVMCAFTVGPIIDVRRGEAQLFSLDP